jgi:ketosteroid isomerase-like protein
MADVGKVEQLELKTADLSVNGSTAIERGTYAVRIRPKHGSPIADHGNYMVYWVQDRGQWKLKWNIAVSDAPAK